MDDNINYIEVVEQARAGDQKSLDSLAELAADQLYAYVYRIVLEQDLTEDIVQESILEMFKILGKLEKADRFWPWLCRIALNKVHSHYRTQRRRGEVLRTMAENGGRGEDNQGSRQDGLAKLVSRELKDIVLVAMKELKPEYREALALRCYEEKQYCQIAELMGRSELSARVLFWRAKKALEKQLSRRGLGKGSLLTALVLFGKMTAPSETAAAKVAVTAAAVKVGPAAALTAIAASKTTVVSPATAGVIAAGSVAVVPLADKTEAEQKYQPSVSVVVSQPGQVSHAGAEFWYYFPKGTAGPVMTRLMEGTDCLLRQNESGNYHFDKRKNTIHIKNHRLWNKDMSVWRLPTDKPALSGFLSEVEGTTGDGEYIARTGEALLVIARPGSEQGETTIAYQYNVLDEEYFRYNHPAGARVVDDRDHMHRRGWTYFTITGQINGQNVKGTGRIPFVYAANEQYWPWMRLRIGRTLVVNRNFVGMGRPWLGLHTIDTVRRDAAHRRIRFETDLLDDNKARVLLTTNTSGQITYTIDTEADIIEKIEFTGEREGELTFEYLQDIDDITSEFNEPTINRRRRAKEKSLLQLLQIIKD